MGVSIFEFEYITPHELNLMIEGFNHRNEQQIYLSWLNASLSKAKKIPDFKKLLPRKQLKKQNSSKTRMLDYEIDIHFNRFLKEGRLFVG